MSFNRPYALVLPLALWLLAPRTAGATDGGNGPVPTSDRRPLHALSLVGHGLFIPRSVLGVGLTESTELNSGGLGLAYTFRRGTFDVVTTVNFSFLGPPDGNFLGNGKMADIDTHYVQFKNLNMFSFDVSFYWVKDMSRYVAFVIGGGIGMAALLGDIHVTNNNNCDATTAHLPASCHPVVIQANYAAVGNPPPTWTTTDGRVLADFGAGDCMTSPATCMTPADPDFQRKLDGLRVSQQVCQAMNGGDCRDTQLHPYTHSAAEKPPVVPIINIQIGVKLKLHRRVNFNIMGGFRNGFIVGGGPEVVF